MPDQLSQEQQDALVGRVFDGGLRPPSTFFFPPPRPRGRIRLPTTGPVATLPSISGVEAAGPNPRTFPFAIRANFSKQTTVSSPAIVGPALIDFVHFQPDGVNQFLATHLAIRISDVPVDESFNDALDTFVPGDSIFENIYGGDFTPVGKDERTGLINPGSSNSNAQFTWRIGKLINRNMFYMVLTYRNDSTLTSNGSGLIRVIENVDPACCTGG